MVPWAGVDRLMKFWAAPLIMPTSGGLEVTVLPAVVGRTGELLDGGTIMEVSVAFWVPALGSGWHQPKWLCSGRAVLLLLPTLGSPLFI